MNGTQLSPASFATLAFLAQGFQAQHLVDGPHSGWYCGKKKRTRQVNDLINKGLVTRQDQPTGNCRASINNNGRKALANEMTADQFKAAIKKLGLSQERAGIFFGVSPRQGQGWALGEYPVPEAVAKLLRLMLKLKLKPDDVK